MGMGKLIGRYPSRLLHPILKEVESFIDDVPDENDPDVINYWQRIDDFAIYLEGWCDECLAGTGFPPMERGETREKVDYIRGLTPGILEKKAKEHNLTLLQGGFKELEDADHLYGVTWGIYRK